MTDTALDHHTQPPFYRNVTVLKWLVQVTTLVLVVGALYALAREAGENLRLAGVSTSFDFLSINPGFDLPEGIDTNPDTGGRALWAGMVNTIRMAIAGIAFATVLGVIIGLARLSPNWIANRVGTIFVEGLRNVPLLVQILIWSAVLTTTAPNLELGTGPIQNWLIISNKGVQIPRVFAWEGFYQWSVILAIGAIGGHFVRRRLEARRDDTGQQTYPILWGLAVVAVFGIVGWFIHPIFSWLGGPLQAISDAIGSLPQGAVQVGLSILAIVLAALWIKRFLDSRRTPAGLAKLTDDDWFRMIFAAVAALVGCFVLLVAWPGLSSWIVNSTSDFFGVAADKFDATRTGAPLDAMRPTVDKPGNFANPGPTGLTMSVFFAAVFFGIWFYTAAFIAEIIRGGILAVPKGQNEAADALGLRRATSLRKVILPQAFRVILPPLGNQYLNLTKNTSLAIAVGFADTVQVSQTLSNQTGRALPVLSIIMLFYLACSLTISLVVNTINRRLQIVER